MVVDLLPGEEGVGEWVERVYRNYYPVYNAIFQSLYP